MIRSEVRPHTLRVCPSCSCQQSPSPNLGLDNYFSFSLLSWKERRWREGTIGESFVGEIYTSAEELLWHRGGVGLWAAGLEEEPELQKFAGNASLGHCRVDSALDEGFWVLKEVLGLAQRALTLCRCSKPDYSTARFGVFCTQG